LEGATKQLDESAAGMQGDVTTVSKPIQWIGIWNWNWKGHSCDVVVLSFCFFWIINSFGLGGKGDVWVDA
jgi:hypothetical protein